MNEKIETITYEGLGFPIELIDVPMKIMGERVVHINLNTLQLEVYCQTERLRAVVFRILSE